MQSALIFDTRSELLHVERAQLLGGNSVAIWEMNDTGVIGGGVLADRAMCAQVRLSGAWRMGWDSNPR